MNQRKRQQGAVIIAVITVMMIASALVGVIFTAFQMARAAQRNAQIATALALISRSALTISGETTDSDNDGYPEAWPQNPVSPAPTGGGQVNASSASPKTDPWGTGFGYCSWDNGATNSSANRINGDNPGSQNSILFAVISAGPNRSFETSCAQAKVNAPQGDDLIAVYQVSQARVVGGTAFTQDAVDCLAVSNPPTTTCASSTSRLDVLVPTSGYTPKPGETRFVREAGSYAFWSASAQAWAYVVPKLSTVTEGNTCNYGPGSMAMDSTSNIQVCQ